MPTKSRFDHLRALPLGTMPDAYASAYAHAYSYAYAYAYAYAPNYDPRHAAPPRHDAKDVYAGAVVLSMGPPVDEEHEVRFSFPDADDESHALQLQRGPPRALMSCR